jgi:class 3 adenylate cyclase
MLPCIVFWIETDRQNNIPPDGAMSLTSFVPRLALDLLGEGPVPDTGRRGQRGAAVLFIDISGFTALADIATTRFGDRGAERLQELLNNCFGPIVDAVDQANGEVLAFPGDAALCLWPVSEGDALDGVARQAAGCALHLRQRLDRIRGFDDAPLRFRALLAAGSIRTLLAGGIDGRWNIVVDGPAIQQLGLINAAAPGEIVVSEEARQCAGSSLIGSSRGATWLLSAVDGPTTHVAIRRPLPGVAAEDIVGLIPVSVRAWAATGQLGWMSEFRAVTVVFTIVGNPAPDDGTPHQIVRTIQTVCQRYDGDLNQVVADEKGLNAVIVFGLFHQTHENQAVRAVATAHEIGDALRARGIAPQIGVATGRVFTGLRGGGSRIEFAVIGSTVVMAARLAATAADVLCDAATCASASTGFAFDAAPPLLLKGKGSVSNVWRPRERTMSSSSHAEAPVGDEVGREIERTRIERRLDALVKDRDGGVLVVSGDPGIGKSSLLAAVRKSARARGLRCIVGAGDSIHMTTTWHAWRSIFISLICGERRHNTGIVERLSGLLGSQEAAWFPLLTSVLPIHLAETEQTRNLTPENRARTTRALLIRLLDRFAEGPLCLVIEDAHWIDSSSWELIEEAAARLPGVLLILTLRQTEETASRLAALRTSHHLEEIALTPMDGGAIREIAARRIGAARLSEELARWIELKCEGNPLFAREIIVTLVETAAAVVHDGVCGVSGNRPLSDMPVLPETVHGVLAARIDRLAADDQLTLKVAAILGRDFRLESLAALSPVAESAAALRERLDRIVRTGLLDSSTDDVSGLSFSHALVQDVAYGLLPFAKRQVLHQCAAEHFERGGGDADAALFPLLAHHWERADVLPKAMLYLERAGEHALLKASANLEAVDFFTRLIRLADAGASRAGGTPSGNVVTAVVRARWERMLSQASARLGRHPTALTHLEQGLRWLGRSMPTDDWKSKLEVLQGLTLRLVRSPRIVPKSGRSALDVDARLETMRLYDSVVQLLYLGQTSGGDRIDNTAMISTTALLRSAALGEKSGPCAELSCAYSMLANLVALFRRRKLALDYAERARLLALEVDDKQALFRALTMGQLPAFIFGRWSDAERRLREAIVLGAALRNTYEMLIGECTLAYIAFHRGQLDDAFAGFASIERRARDAGFVLPVLWAHAGMAEVQLRQDRVSDAIGSALACLGIAAERHAVDQNSRFQVHGVLASAYVRRGEHENALAQVEPAARAALAGAQLSFTAQAGFVGVIDALLAARASRAIEVSDGDARLRRWLRRFRAAAFCRPILEPSCLQCRAAWNRHLGRMRRARRQLLASIHLAERLGMPHEARRGRQTVADLASSPRGIEPL